MQGTPMGTHSDSVRTLDSVCGLAVSVNETCPPGAICPIDVIRIIPTANQTASSVVTITNAPFGQACKITIPDPGSSTATFALAGTVNQTAQCKMVTCTASALANGGKVPVWVHTSSTASILITNIQILFTGLSGGLLSGNRSLQITDGNLSYNDSGISASLLASPVFSNWGAAGNLAGAETLITTPGLDVYFRYGTGNTDYYSGSVSLAVFYTQVTA